MFPNEFFILASIRSQKTSDPLCMILYTCCDGRPGLDIELCRDPGLPIVAGIIPTIASGNASEDRGNTALGDNVFSSEQAFLLRIISEILNEELIKRLEESSVDVVDLLLSNDHTDVILSLLYDLEPPAIIRKTLKDGETLDLNLGSTKLCPYKGFRRDLVVIIGNCAYRRKNVQDEIRQKSGIPLLLQ
ncbi:hypothetical protein PVK06_001163 [Gossypium arboreum]|uniref:Ataxin-10 domain-containing protein n=1 Tax=Gossypium arboreum TaxID=29729 RepID=A0ABR0R0E3_GOSAR|nr:hypothetical protein PVK06_001163 [Gossypium arboreum]